MYTNMDSYSEDGECVQSIVGRVFYFMSLCACAAGYGLCNLCSRDFCTLLMG